MNSNRTIKILVAALVLLGGVWAFKTYWPKDSGDVGAYERKWVKLAPEKVSAVTITKNSQTLTFTKDGALWRFDSIQADSGRVEELVQNLLQPQEVTIVAVTSARHADLGVASGSAVVALTGDGNQTKSVHVGNPGTGGRYVRFDDNDTVYLVPDLPAGSDSADRTDWVDKTLVTLPEAKIIQITLDRPGGKLVLHHTNNQWFQEGNRVELDPASFSGLTSTLASFVTQGLSTDAAPKNPTVTVTVTRTEGNPLVLKLYSGKDSVIVESSDRPGLYAVSKSVLDNFTFDKSVLKPKPSPTPAPKS